MYWRDAALSKGVMYGSKPQKVYATDRVFCPARGRKVAPQLTVVTSTIFHRGAAVPVTDVRAASVVSSETAGHEMTAILARASNDQ